MDLTNLLADRENHSIEFKERATPDVGKEVAAFASSRGGIVVLGVRDHDRAVVGLGESFDVAFQTVQNQIHEFVRPAPAYSIGRADHSGQEILIITVEAGLEAAYAFKERFYYRNNEQSQPIPASEVTRRFANAQLSKDLKELAEWVDHSHPNNHFAAGIEGQGDLATMMYRDLLDRLIGDLQPHFEGR